MPEIPMPALQFIYSHCLLAWQEDDAHSQWSHTLEMLISPVLFSKCMESAYFDALLLLCFRVQKALALQQ
jgi:hypothetical protein